MPKGGKSQNPKKSIRENSGSEVDLVDYRHVILEVRHVVENQPLRLTERVVADDPLLCWHLAQVNILTWSHMCETWLKACVRSLYSSRSFPMQIFLYIERLLAQHRVLASRCRFPGVTGIYILGRSSLRVSVAMEVGGGGAVHPLTVVVADHVVKPSVCVLHCKCSFYST
jgi:hypothetical protein